MKRYKIVRIDEADYGCEGRPDGEEAMDSVWLEDENGERQIVRASDRMLYDRHLDEGSLVTFDEMFFVKHFSLKKASEFPVFSEGFSLL